MGIRYDKELITKDRRIMTSGPRDRQRKQQMQSIVLPDQSGLIDELRAQIAKLQAKIDSAPAGGYTAEQVNEEIEKAIKAETADLRAKLEIERNNSKNLRDEILQLNSKIKDRDKTIESLNSKKADIDNNVTTLLTEATKKIEALSTQMAMSGTADSLILESAGSSRPKMETVFVDPIEKESKVEKHFEVEVEDVSPSKKEEMDNKVNKLRNLLGKLPSKR